MLGRGARGHDMRICGAGGRLHAVKNRLMTGRDRGAFRFHLRVMNLKSAAGGFCGAGGF